MSQEQTLRGVGRLHLGQRNLGCVGYVLQSFEGANAVIRFDPMPDAAHGDIFHLTLEDGRVLECQVLTTSSTFCAVIDGPRPERRHHCRPTPATRAYL